MAGIPTWRNIDAPNFGSANQMFDAGGDRMLASWDRLSAIAREQAANKTKEGDEISGDARAESLRLMLGASDTEELAALKDSGQLETLAENMRSKDELQSLTDLDNRNNRLRQDFFQDQNELRAQAGEERAEISLEEMLRNGEHGRQMASANLDLSRQRLNLEASKIQAEIKRDQAEANSYLAANSLLLEMSPDVLMEKGKEDINNKAITALGENHPAIRRDTKGVVIGYDPRNDKITPEQHKVLQESMAHGGITKEESILSFRERLTAAGVDPRVVEARSREYAQNWDLYEKGAAKNNAAVEAAYTREISALDPKGINYPILQEKDKRNWKVPSDARQSLLQSPEAIKASEKEDGTYERIQELADMLEVDGTFGGMPLTMGELHTIARNRSGSVRSVLQDHVSKKVKDDPDGTRRDPTMLTQAMHATRSGAVYTNPSDMYAGYAGAASEGVSKGVTKNRYEEIAKTKAADAAAELQLKNLDAALSRVGTSTQVQGGGIMGNITTGGERKVTKDDILRDHANNSLEAITKSGDIFAPKTKIRSGTPTEKAEVISRKLTSIQFSTDTKRKQEMYDALFNQYGEFLESVETD